MLMSDESAIGDSNLFAIWDHVDYSHGLWDPDHLATPVGRSALTGGKNRSLGALKVKFAECELHVA